MGDYITYAELVLRYPMIKQWNSGANNATMVNSFMIYYAEKQLNSLLGTHFTVPFSAGHPTVKDLTFDLCKYRALSDQQPEKAADFHSLIIDRIDRIKEGKEVIYTDSGTLEPTGDGQEIWSTTMDYHPTHSMLDEDSEYTMVSSERLHDEENERD